MVVDSSGKEEEEEGEEFSGDFRFIGNSSTAEQEMEFVGALFSWSLDDIFNEHLFQVPKIPGSFESAKQYFSTFVLPLLEETRAELESAMEAISTAPFAKVTSFEECKAYGTFMYDVQVCDWGNCYGGSRNERYKTLPGDIVVLAAAKPETVSDLQRVGRWWSLALVTAFSEDDDKESTNCSHFRVQASNVLKVGNEVTVIFLINITTNWRVWNALHLSGNLSIINKALSEDTLENGNHSCQYEDIDTDLNMDSSNLNESQIGAILACLQRVHCSYTPGFELISGPPGSGKTSTISTLLVTLLGMERRTLTCAPTNVALKEVASRVVKLLKESAEIAGLPCPLGAVLLFGDTDRLKIGSEVEEIYLDNRVKKLEHYFATDKGWHSYLTSMEDFLILSVDHFLGHQENEKMNEERKNHENEDGSKGSTDEKKYNSFLEYARARFLSTVLPLQNCMTNLFTQVPASFMGRENIDSVKFLAEQLEYFRTLLFCDSVKSNELQQLFTNPNSVEDPNSRFTAESIELCNRRGDCLSAVKSLRRSLEEVKFPSSTSKSAIRNFCFHNASLIFCTVSSAHQLHSVGMHPLKLEVLVIDEAAQLKECESTIPLQLPGIRHAILSGDECQLPAIVRSKGSSEAGFGRSLFERVTSLQHPVHFLNMQYRMHPFISSFPNSMFYSGTIQDGDNVNNVNYQRRYLSGPMFGPYSFINVNGGREELDEMGHGWRNMAEASIVLKLVHNLYEARAGSNQKLCIGVISPYAAQVIAIKKKLGHKYGHARGFSLKVKTIDGLQGGEEDIIIISTVRSNPSGLIDALSNVKTTIVTLTRARHCLWILGSAGTLTSTESIWKRLVYDAKDRNCFYEVDEDKSLGKVVVHVKKDHGQLEDLLTGDSILFRNARWKVLFSDYFKASFGRLATSSVKMTVLTLLLKLSGGWRPRKINVDIKCEGSSHIVKQFKVEGLRIICSIDISKEIIYTQILKVWDVLLLEDVPKLVKRLEGIFATYTENFINHCNEIFHEGDLEVPKTWPAGFQIKRYKSIGHDDNAITLGCLDDECYVENSRVSDSLLLMKFYSLSYGVVKFLLSDVEGKELELPFEVTEEEQELIVFPRSMFILGRSGTGKTTVLVMKLLRKEQLYNWATEGLHEERRVDTVLDTGEAKTVLRQLFVTVSGKLCHAVKNHVSQLKSFASGGKYSDESSSMNMVNIDDTVQFKDIPDSFVDIPPYLFPIVITFFKFLMMVDGTIGSSYFERFPDARQFLHRKTDSLASLGLQAFITTREVNYERFSLGYWPHFNANLTSKFDSSRVFTEIMSHIKGGLREGSWSSDSILSRSDYILLSDSRNSSLDGKERELVYQICEDYEKMKMKRGDFDMADLVIDLHRRLKSGKYKGELMDYVYIDEVQDLTMRQIAIFKHVCKNINEGYVFSGDTAQTIARGIDFRFEDIRSLFYNEFICDARKGKGQISKIFHLTQNFRTHAGVIKLAQSVIDLLYHFFPSSLDKLEKETSLIYGEAPVFLEVGTKENAIATIFGDKAKDHFVGFGAQQVILVRDDFAKEEICKDVGKQALVLTIAECKGLEFQDVLLYNFFGSSPLGTKWRVVYEYMRNQNLLDPTLPGSPPVFDWSKHNLMCSELKLLYVAITRTKQRLWLCENVQDCSKSMFDYWKKKGLVQIRQLDKEIAKAMQVASAPEEWTAQGYKLLQEGNYEMATLCFERAGDGQGEKLAKAARLRASADNIQSSNPEEASIFRKQAADIFESIGKTELAAECFYMLKDYEKAGNLYLRRGESAKVKAGDCFCLAGSFKLAADLYFDGSHFPRCMAACTEGKLFVEGLHYLQQWKQGNKTHNSAMKWSTELEKLEHEFLQIAAVHCHKFNDRELMMKYVKAFESLESMRTFLRSLGYLDELLLFEEEYGNFLEAANIAKLKGDFLLEADLLGKAKHYVDASTLILAYVLANSLWLSGLRGWPLKQFKQKKSLLEKAKSLAKEESEQYFNFVSLQVKILLNEESSLLLLQRHLSDSQRQKSIICQILSVRKILDLHFKLNISKYAWVEKIILDVRKVSADNASVETLIHYWTLWRDLIMEMLQYIEDVSSEDSVDLSGYGEICCNYFGVRRCFRNGNLIYSFLNSDAQWIRDIESRYLSREGKLTCIDVKYFLYLATRYWSTVLFTVGFSVIGKLKELYDSFSSQSSLFSSRQMKPLIHIYGVAGFLFNTKFLSDKSSEINEYIKFLSFEFFECLFPLDSRESMNEKMVFFRRTEMCKNLVTDFLIRHSSSQSRLSYGQLGRIAVLLLGCAGKTFHGSGVSMSQISGDSKWKSLIDYLMLNDAEIPNDLECAIHRALQMDNFVLDLSLIEEFISPSCFLYLLERQVILVSAVNGFFITTKSSFIEWLIYQEGRDGSLSTRSKSYSPETVSTIAQFILEVAADFLGEKKYTLQWASTTYRNGSGNYGTIILRLVLIVCSLYFNFGGCYELICDLLSLRHVTENLPNPIYKVLRQIRTSHPNCNLQMFTESFKMIGNPLVVASLGKNCPKCPSSAVFVDMTSIKSIDDVFGLFFDQKEAVNQLWDTFDILLSSGNQVEEESSDVQIHPSTKIEIEKVIHLLSNRMDQNPADEKSRMLLLEAASTLDELKQLHSMLDLSGINSSNIGELVKKLQSRRPTVEELLKNVDSEEQPDAESGMQTGSSSNAGGGKRKGSNKKPLKKNKGKGGRRNK
ncbi:TPR and ankyrin repeat-containing protein 1 [Linum grandiflorum]